MIGYVTTLHPTTGERIQVIPTGKTNGAEAEFRVLSPKSNLTTLWLRHSEILKE